MAIELNFEKTNDANWGFRLTGGADFSLPVMVVKVTENSVAELGGLRTNDIIVRVNDTPTAGLTHMEVHDALVSGGNHLTLALYRDLSGNISSDDLNDDEVTEIMQRYTDYEEVNPETSPGANNDKTVTFEHTPVELNPPQHNGDVSLPENEPHKQNGHHQEENQERKWSTFLQKPKNPKPILKNADQTITSEPYRVVIKKQKKKTGRGKPEDTDPIKISEETHEPEQNGDEEIKEEEVCDTRDSVEREEVEETEEVSEAPEEVDESREESIIEDAKEIRKPADDPSRKLLEEKLAEVQRQLEALSMLPSTIQSTIDAVTKQLASIVEAKISTDAINEDAEENLNSEDNDFTERVLTEDSASDNEEVRELDEDSLLETIDEEHEHLVPEQEPEEQIEEIAETVEEPDPEEGLTEEEKEERRLEQKLLDKQQKELEMLKRQRVDNKPPKPIERPIILPGGRRWSQPDDACPAIRHPKMSDDKIADTIETYSEVIVGKAKGLTIGMKCGRGPINKNLSTESNCCMVPSRTSMTKRINFLKYQPPPKNLDYLQKSEVYRLVHDMEPPVRGISSRACKILAEQDYYQENEIC